MNDQQLLRYSRHILLPEIGIEGQQRLLSANVLIVGLGGLGSPAAMYLAASGVGRLTLCDDDSVELSNMQRQIVHRNPAIGLPKVASAEATLRDINPDVSYTAVSLRADAARLSELVADADVVLDCSDNFATRYAINHACLIHRKPLVSGAAIQFAGQISVFDFRLTDTPCYNCLFPQDSEAAELRCATTGIFAPLTGLIGTLQAAETLKLLIGIDTGLNARLLTINALDMRIKQSLLQKDPDCRACAA